MSRSPSVERRLMLSFGVFGIYWGGWGALLPEIKANVNASEATLGGALLFIAVGAIIGMLAAGRLFDRYGTAVIAASHVFFALAAVPPVLARRPGHLIGMLLLLGLTTGMLDVVINGATARYESQSGTLLMGRVHAMFSLGVLVAGVSVGTMRDAGASELAILLPIALLILVGAGASRSVRLPRTEETSRSSARPTRAVLILGTLCGLAFLIEDGMLSWSAIHLEQTLGGSPTLGGLGPTCLAAAMVTGRALTSKISARFKDRAVLRACGAIAAIGVAVTATATSPAIALAGIGVTGAGISVCAPLILSYAGRSAAPDRQGAVVSTVTTIAYMGFIVGPPLVGGVAGIAGLRIGIGAMALVAVALAAGSQLVPIESGVRSTPGR
jgi:MFS family permease